ncbi:hypothetical protein [Campylobacter jejuni]|uniref:hypothetical protein n=1 Tax=Campylobacter jejuni TaxID=197 RepID=UPI001F29F812|nr:hypothetical protein [Campylobacter jejuni]
MQRAELGTGLACAGERKDICWRSPGRNGGMEQRHLPAFENRQSRERSKAMCRIFALAVLDCKETATSRETFIRLMNERGYGVDWQDSHKYITYTDLAREQAGERLVKSGITSWKNTTIWILERESMEHEFERNARTAEAEQSREQLQS